MLVIALSACGGLRTPSPDAFYAAPSSLPSHPGALLRTELFGRGLPAHSHGWRMLYTSTRADGTAAVASAIVLVSDRPQRGPRHLIAWLHGTTGIVSGCAPSLLRDPMLDVPALRAALRAGWVIVATDYIGLGTRGPHPYLIGEGEARSALDSIRATHQLQQLQLAGGAVIWGVSQGGHAALWSATLASSYAKDVTVQGVAAISAATDLVALMPRINDTLIGRALSALLVHTYAQQYPDVRISEYVAGELQPRVAALASRCLVLPQALPSAWQSWITHRSIFARDPTRGPLGRRLAENVPPLPVGIALFIAQGAADETVWPDVQSAYVQAHCTAAHTLTYRIYERRTHVSILASGSPFNEDLLRWTQQRFAGIKASAGCNLPLGAAR